MLLHVFFSFFFCMVLSQKFNSLYTYGLWIVFLCVWFDTLDTLDILCVGLKLGTSFKRVWDES